MNRPSLVEFLADKSWQGCTVAHRCAWHESAENSLLAVEQAIDLGCAFVEVDVQQTIDGMLFCLHDNSLERNAHKPDFPAAVRWDQVSNTRLVKGFGGPGAELTDQIMPTLEAMLECAKDRIYVDLDAKRPYYLKEICDLVNKVGMQEQVNVKSWVLGKSEFDLAKSLNEEFNVLVKPIIYIGRSNFDLIIQMVKELDVPVVEAYFEDWEVACRFGEAMKRINCDIFVNTLDEARCTHLIDSDGVKNPEAVWGTLMNAGIRLLQTDEPEALQQLFGARALAA